MILLCFLCLFLLLALTKIVQKLWWTPTRIQYLMASQGIKGPSYRFIHGSTKEITTMKREAMSRPMGLSHAIFSEVQPHIHSWIETYGKNYLQWHGLEAEFIITEPELIKEVLNNRNRAYPKAETKGYLKKLLGNGLLTTEGEKWTKLRKLANYTFHGESLRGMIPAIVSSVEVMLERWKHHEGKEVEVFEEFRLLTSEIISRTAFGSSYREGNKIFDMLVRLILLTSKNSYKHGFPGLSKIFKNKDEIEAEMLEKEIRNCIKEMIKKREEKVMNNVGEEKENGFGSDFLGVLLRAHHDTNDNQRISFEDLVDECKAFYVVGQETTNSLLAWTVFLLALHTHWQVETRKEMLNVIGQEKPNPDDISKLKTMSMVINESLRLYPPVIGIIRKVDREVRLGSLILPPNLQFYISNLAIHHDPQIWGEDVHQFKPERFSNGIAKATNDNNGALFFPFGIGPRTCVGMNLALTQAKIALSMILQRYAFTLSPAYVHSPFQLSTLHAQHGVQVMLQPVSEYRN